MYRNDTFIISNHFWFVNTQTKLFLLFYKNSCIFVADML
nr:MAG TPA: hypothetical protein [Bacteriophage sp.]